MCGVHRSSLLKVETPHIQKHETRKQQNSQTPKTTQQQEKQARTTEFHLCTSMVKHNEKRELWLIATWASNSISRCCPFTCEVVLCDRPVCGQAWSQALADASAQAIQQNGNLAASYCELRRKGSLRVREVELNGLGAMLFWPWKTALPWSQSFHAIAKAGRAAAYGGQHAYGSHCFQVRRPAPDDTPSTEGAGGHITSKLRNS